MPDRSPRHERFAPRPPAKLDRPPLPREEIARIRRERLDPRPTQWDYLHLEGLRRGLSEAFSTIPRSNRPSLDLFCGTKPYSPLVPASRVWGVDLDRHFAGADVLSAVPLPFRDGAFSIVLCSQALHLVDDPVATVAEMARVLTPDGRAVVTVPHLFIGEGDLERHWSQADVRTLFVGWHDVSVRGIDGLGAALAFVVGRLTMLASRRWPAVRMLYTPLVVLMNKVCRALDWVLVPFARRWPHSLIVVARPPKVR
jgi:SAM-dependent methyltransferase